MHKIQALLISFIFLISGCLNSSVPDENDISQYEWWEVPLEKRHLMDLNFSSWRSTLPVKGIYDWTGPTEYFVEVDLPLEERDAGYPEDPLMHVALWMPNVPEGTLVPVIATVHPYYEFAGSNPNTIPDLGIGQWVLEEFVPHGYALAQISTFGSGKSTHCQDVKGLGEQIGIQAAVDWLGKQPWSNGNVGLMGKSYAGTTNWEAAQNPSPHLKTIVPISGTTGLHPLLYKNGSAEARSQVMHMSYFSSTVDYNADDLDNICPDIIEGFFAGPVTYGLGELDPYMENYYDERSHIDKAFGEWSGSVYWVQGLQDWNVDPHQVFGGPSGTHWYQAYIDAGYEVRGILGQWGHDYPDQWQKHDDLTSGYGGEAFQNMTRWDWAQDLFEWFEYYLKDIGPAPALHAQVQRNDGEWRIEETWPPLDVERMSLDMSECSNDGAFLGGGAPVVGGGQVVTVECPAMSDSNLHIAGLATLHLQAVPTFDGGQVFIEMQDAETGLRLGHATMDIRYHAGGYDAQTVIPGVAVTMMMEFQAIDAILPAGHGLLFIMSDQGEDYLAPACGNACTVHVLPSSSTLELPIIDRDGSNVLITPQSE